jgi:hypothetical protein
MINPWYVGLPNSSSDSSHFKRLTFKNLQAILVQQFSVEKRNRSKMESTSVYNSRKSNRKIMTLVKDRYCKAFAARPQFQEVIGMRQAVDLAALHRS